MRYLIVLLLLAGCGTQSVLLLPRGHAVKGEGTIQDGHEMRVQIEGRTYSGKLDWDLGFATSTNPYGYTTTHRSSSDRAAALLLGESGQVRCDFTLSLVTKQGNGVCVDSLNRTYDMVIR
jgi:hypothetical protein